MRQLPLLVVFASLLPCAPVLAGEATPKTVTLSLQGLPSIAAFQVRAALEAGGCSVARSEGAQVVVRVADLAAEVHKLAALLMAPDAAIDCSRSSVKNAYFANVVRCLPDFLPAIARHDGYYNNQCEDLDGTRAAFALLVHRLWRSPAYVEKLWTAVREPVFAAISLSDYDQREFGKTVEALLRAHARIAAIPGCQPLLKETLAKLQALHQNPSKRNGVYGWPWIEAYDERLLVEDESGISSAWLASFWVRREAEGTREIALSILREIKAHYEKLAARGEVLPSGKADVTGAQPLSREALSKLDARQLRFLRNTLYARHGRDFDSFSLKVYFSRTDWYHPDPAYTDKVLTEVDKANLVLIDEAEKRAGGAMSEERYLDWMFRTLSAMAPKGSPVLEQSLDGKWIVPLACGVERQSIGLSRDSDGVRLIESLGDGTAWAKSCRIVLLEQEGEALVGYDFGPSSCPTVRIHKEGGHIIWDQVHYAPPGAKVRREEIIDKSYCGSAQ